MAEINTVTLDLETYDNMVELIHEGTIAISLIIGYSKDRDDYTYIPHDAIRSVLPEVYKEIKENEKNNQSEDR